MLAGQSLLLLTGPLSHRLFFGFRPPGQVFEARKCPFVAGSNAWQGGIDQLCEHLVLLVAEGL